MAPITGRVVVTGAAGFIGSHMVDRLLDRGCAVVGFDDLSTGRLSNVAHLSTDTRFELRRVDICDGIDVEGAVSAVVHLASPASPVDYLALPIETMRVGSIGTLNALELARAKGARFLVSSTSEVYGDPLVHPQTEDYWGNVNPIGPRSVYDEAKRFTEALTASFERTYSLDVRIARIFNTYGPRMRPDDGRVVSNFIVQALEGRDLTIYGDGSQTRSFCYVDDEVDGLLRLLDSDARGPVNIGNDAEFEVRELARLVIDSVGSATGIVERDLPVDDPRQRRPDLHRARTELGWEPRIPLAEGVRATAEHFRRELGVDLRADP